MLKFKVLGPLCTTYLSNKLTLNLVLLQAMKEDPPAGYKCRDKFLVQSVAITADREYSSVQQIVRFLSSVTWKLFRPNFVASGLLWRSMKNLPSRRRKFV